MLYLDASLIVALFTSESHTARAQAWMECNESEGFAVSRWVSIEVAAALAAKVRAGFLSESLKEEVLLLYARTARQSFSPLDVRVQDFDQAMGLASETAAGVRGGDALHLAIAMRHGATLCTLDARQAEAAGVLGIDAKLV